MGEYEWNIRQVAYAIWTVDIEITWTELFRFGIDKEL